MGFDVLTTNTSPLDLLAILDRLKKRLAPIGGNLRLIEIRLLTVKNNVNTFHGSETKSTQLLREIGRKT